MIRAAVVALLLALPASASAAGFIAAFHGHAAVGYTKLFTNSAPGGSMTAGGGLDVPLYGDFRAGVDVVYDLLGSRNVERGSLAASVDYTALTAAALVHWTPHGWGPVGRVSFGPALINTHAELSTAGGGAMFSDLAVSQTAPGAMLAATIMSTRESPVRVGFEVGARIAFLDGVRTPVEGTGRYEDTDFWVLTSGRLVFHY